MEHLGSVALILVFSYSFIQAMKTVSASRRCVAEKRRIECEMAPRFIRISTELYREKRKPPHHVNLAKMQALTEDLDESVEIFHRKLDEVKAAETENVRSLRLV